MNENFDELESAQDKYIIKSESFEINFSKFISDPIGFLKETRINYLSGHKDNVGKRITYIIDEILNYIENAEETIPDMIKHEILSPFFINYDSDQETRDEGIRSFLSL